MVDIQIITKLREMTGAGMVDCQKALAESNGNLDQAVEILRKKGEAKAAKKAERATNEGVVAVAKSGDKLAYVALKSETDFVALTADFIAATQSLADQLLAASTEEFKTLAEAKIKNELVVKIGENIQLGSYGIVNGSVLGYYIHANRKLAAIVSLAGGSEALAADVAMQVVAMNPEYLKPEDVPADIVAKEKEIAMEQLKTEGKPAEIAEKIVAGKLNKFYEDICLNKQFFIKDDKKTIEDYVKEAGQGASIISFIRISV